MAQISNTYETYDAVGNREELADKIYQITPEETPFLSMIGKKKVSSVHPEWQTDTLRTPVTTNNRPEGNDWTYGAITPTVRVGNYTQISDETIIISRTQENTTKAGRKSELAREIGKAGVALRTDMEVTALSNQASSAGSGDGATNRTLGGFRAWLATNDDLGATGASGGFNTGTSVVDAATNGTQRAFTKAIMDAVILASHTAGGNPKACICSPYVKTIFSTFMDDANVVPMRKQAGSGKNTIIGTAEIYQSDFGNIAFVPNRQMSRAGAAVARNAFFVDPDQVRLGVFDDIMVKTPAITGDATKKVLVAEYSLCVDNEAAHGVAADLYGLTAST